MPCDLNESSPAAAMPLEPVLSRDQSRRVDRLAAETLGIPGLVLMENAGLNATAALLNELDAQRDLAPEQARVAIVCGGGNNGGDGYVIARHLHNWGAAVDLYSAVDPDKLKGDAATNHAICHAMGLRPIVLSSERSARDAAKRWGGCDAVVDALLGTGFTGRVREPLDAVIEAINATAPPLKLAVDCPSGLDADTGEPSNATLRADLTVTFVARKRGFDTPGSAAYTGRVVVAEIGTPPSLLERVLGDAAD